MPKQTSTAQSPVNVTAYFLLDLEHCYARPSARIAEKRPSLVGTFSGPAVSAVLKDGQYAHGTPMGDGFRKEITREVAASAGFSWNATTGLLTIPSGRKGRTASVRLSAADAAADFAQ